MIRLLHEAVSNYCLMIFSEHYHRIICKTNFMLMSRGKYE